jgi:hypothetical protein
MNGLVDSMADPLIQVIAANGATIQHPWNPGYDDSISAFSGRTQTMNLIVVNWEKITNKGISKRIINLGNLHFWTYRSSSFLSPTITIRVWSSFCCFSVNSRRIDAFMIVPRLILPLDASPYKAIMSPFLRRLLGDTSMPHFLPPSWQLIRVFLSRNTNLECNCTKDSCVRWQTSRAKSATFAERHNISCCLRLNLEVLRLKMIEKTQKSLFCEAWPCTFLGAAPGRGILDY